MSKCSSAVLRANKLFGANCVAGVGRSGRTSPAPTLFHGRGGKPYSYFGVSAMFRRACKNAGVEDFHLHDIRAKALTDAEHQGLDAQRLAGHKSRAMTEHYIKARETEKATPPSLPKNQQKY